MQSGMWEMKNTDTFTPLSRVGDTGVSRSAQMSPSGTAADQALA
jgi:hypothetical protein